MAATPAPTIVNVGYKSTNFWVVSAGTSRLLVDLGWPGTFDTLRRQLERANVPLSEIRYGFATHYHIDHAGLAQELKRTGMQLVVADVQVEWIPRMKDHIKPTDRFTDITLHDNHVIRCDESRSLLHSLGIAGEIIHTPGHSDDSVSLLLDTGEVFTGDLTHPMLMTDAERATTLASWRRLQAAGARVVYPGHGPVRPMESLATAPEAVPPVD